MNAILFVILILTEEKAYIFAAKKRLELDMGVQERHCPMLCNLLVPPGRDATFRQPGRCVYRHLRVSRLVRRAANGCAAE